MLEGLLGLLITALVVALVAGLLMFLVDRAPMIEPLWKQWLRWLVLAIAVLIIIIRALPLLGVSV